MNAARRLVQACLRRLGYQLVPVSRSPLLQDLTGLRNTLNHAPVSQRRALEQLGHITLGCQLEWLLASYEINLVVDVGANDGQFAEEIRRLGYAGRIASFEPMTACVATLRGKASADPLWSVHACGLGSAAGELRLTVFADSSFSSLHTPNPAARAEFGGLVVPVGVETVPIRTFDQVWPEITRGLDHPRVLLKSDTQGHDLEVLRGAPDHLAACAVVLCEVAFTPLYDAAPRYHDLLATLESGGFECAALHPLSYHADRPSLIEANAVFVNPQLRPGVRATDIPAAGIRSGP